MIFTIKSFDKTIQLYGDRAGGQGNFDFAGLAELQTIKVVLLKGNPHSLEQPADWRRFLRLLDLAQRLHKPVLLWNLPLTQNTSIEKLTSLELGTAIKDVRIKLLRLPQPIISVFDDTFSIDNENYILKSVDGIIVVVSDEENDKEEQIIKQNNLSHVNQLSDISKKVSELLDEFSREEVNELFAKRIERLQNTENR